jgi:hypothetical protein
MEMDTHGISLWLLEHLRENNIVDGGPVVPSVAKDDSIAPVRVLESVT